MQHLPLLYDDYCCSCCYRSIFRGAHISERWCFTSHRHRCCTLIPMILMDHPIDSMYGRHVLDHLEQETDSSTVCPFFDKQSTAPGRLCTDRHEKNGASLLISSTCCAPIASSMLLLLLLLLPLRSLQLITSDSVMSAPWKSTRYANVLPCKKLMEVILVYGSK